MEKDYLSGTPQEAKSTIEKWIELLKDWEAHDVSFLEFDLLYGVAHARLFMINEYLGNTNSAREHLTASINYFDAYAVDTDMGRDKFDETSVREYIKNWDVRYDLPWMEREQSPISKDTPAE